MTAIRDASTMYTSLFSLVLFLLLFTPRHPWKKTVTLTIALMGPLLIVNFVLLSLLGPMVMSTLLLLTCSLPSLIFFWFLSKYRDSRFFFTFFFCDTVILEILDITSVLDYFLGNTYLFMAVSRLLLCPVVAFAFRKWLQPIYIRLQAKVEKGWYTFSAIALILYVMMSMDISVPSHITQRPQQLPAFILLLILLPFLYCHIFSTLAYQQEAYETEEQEKIQSLQVTSLLSRLEEFRASNVQLQQERHDFRHKMRTIAALAEKSDLAAINQAIAAYSKALPEPAPDYYCDHKILDAVLAFYLGAAKRKGIRVTTKLIFPESLPVNETDLATVLANALENAIQACERIEMPKRYIEVKSIIHPQFMLQVRNSFDGLIAFNEDGIPLTTRKGHGFGTRSIAAFCKQTNTFYEFGAAENEFTLRLIFHR